jgi:protoporphyrinogen/coproporphyrinogen III oxidase
MKKHIVVIGGGMAGSAAAYRLRQLGYNVTILEKSDRLGGRIHSIAVGDTIVELGAGFLTNSYYNVLSFLSVSGLEKQRYTQRSKSGIIRNGTLFSPASLFFSLSFRSKIVFIQLFATVLVLWNRIAIKDPASASAFDTRSVADMFRKISDKQVLEYVFQPILNGYCFWTPEQTSQAMLLVFAKFLLSGGRYRLRKGLAQIPQMAAKGASVLLAHSVTNVRSQQESYLVTFQQRGKEHTMQADGVVCATTASVVPHIFPELTMQQKKFFSSVVYSSTIVVAYTYKQKIIGNDVACAIPRREKSEVATITVASEKQKGYVIRAVKVYIPGRKFFTLTDEEVLTKVAEHFASIRHTFLADDAELIASHVHRWVEAIPVFNKGDMNRSNILTTNVESTTSALVFAGDYLGGPCIEWSFISGVSAADRLHAKLCDHQ